MSAGTISWLVIVIFIIIAVGLGWAKGRFG